jgi:hypothetical protein
VELEKEGEDFLDRSCEKKQMLHRIKEERNILHKTQQRKVNWIGHMLNRNFLLEHVIERKIKRKIEGKRRLKQLLHALNESISHWNLKEEALDRTLWRTRFGKGYGPVARQTTQ